MQLADIPRLQNTWAYGYIVDGIKYLAAGAVVDAVRRAFVWLYNRVKLRYSTSAEFVLGDPAYEWIVLFLTENNVWQKARDFRVTSKSSKLVYGVAVSADPDITGSADYVPSYESPQLFRWRGTWVEIQRYRAQVQGAGGQPQQVAAIYVTVFTRDLSVLSELVEEAHRGYQAKIKPYVTIFLADSPSYGGSFLWNVKRKPHRPIESIILPDGVLNDLISDAKRFLASEAWYHRAGIPHRMGYLLYGPPGTGKSSTIHAVAGELNLEIHSFSLSATFVDDSFLNRAISTIPKRSIVLVEDIDCALPSREEDDDSDPGSPILKRTSARGGGVTLSGLLNMIDGIGSEEGKLFFATTNYVDRLDPALMRPGRIDRRIRYTLATRAQAKALYERLYRDAEVDEKGGRRPGMDGDYTAEEQAPDEPDAEGFAAAMRDYEYSTAELQGYLLTNRDRPVAAAAEMGAWVARQRIEREEKEVRNAERKERKERMRAAREAARYHFAHAAPYPYPPFTGAPPPPGRLHVSIPTPPGGLAAAPVPSQDPPLALAPPPPSLGGDADEVTVPPAADADISAPAGATTISPSSPPSAGATVTSESPVPSSSAPPLPLPPQKLVNGIHSNS
ncbi:P-loop containing nucleoside triphosphate hydrolase protein [Mycena rebaudengoi]|nr:P-loop containing nucleoside triphosphate hydrolase protein [Mycena rebaudengoi]